MDIMAGTHDLLPERQGANATTAELFPKAADLL
jgi:hypothetical protein